MKGKYIDRFDIHTMQGYVLRHRIEQWLEERFDVVHDAAEKLIAGEPISQDCLCDDIQELLCVIMFMRDVEIITARVYSRYKTMLNRILFKLEGE